jgi:hypothetical protein
MIIAIQAHPRERVCLMRIMGPAIRRRFVKLFGGGEDGIIEEMKKILFLYSKDIEKEPDHKKVEYFEMLLKMYKAIYGDKRVHISEKKPISIELQEVDGSYVTKEIAIEKSFPMGDMKAMAKEHLKEVDPQSDPESLINSPIIEGFVNLTPTWTEDMQGRKPLNGIKRSIEEVKHDGDQSSAN